MKPKRVAGLIISQRKPDEKDAKPNDMAEGDGEDQAGMACAEDMIRAIHAKDAKHLLMAMRAMMDCIDEDSSNDEESNDYDSLNMKAAKESQE